MVLLLCFYEASEGSETFVFHYQWAERIMQTLALYHTMNTVSACIGEEAKRFASSDNIQKEG